MRERKNTPLARRIAGLFEQHRGHSIPGGPDNACIERTYVGYHQKGAGMWSWTLQCVDGQYVKPALGSEWPATEVVKGIAHDPKLADVMLMTDEPCWMQPGWNRQS